MTHKKHIKQNNKPASRGDCLKSSHLTQFFLFFFLFLASASMLEPTLEWLVALLMLLTLSEECCLLMRRSGCWFCRCWLPLLPAEEGIRQKSQYWVFVLQISQSSACLQCVCTRLVSFRHQFGRVDDPIDGGLGDSVLLLQQLDGLPEVVQLRVLQRDEGQPNDASLVFNQIEAAFTFCSAVSVRLFSLMVMLPRLCSNAATRWACKRHINAFKVDQTILKTWVFKFCMSSGKFSYPHTLLFSDSKHWSLYYVTIYMYNLSDPWRSWVKCWLMHVSNLLPVRRRQAEFLCLEANKVCSDNLSSSCHVIKCLTTAPPISSLPHRQLWSFSVCQHSQHAFLHRGAFAVNLQSTSGTVPRQSAETWLRCNQTPAPSFHVCVPDSNQQRWLQITSGAWRDLCNTDGRRAERSATGDSLRDFLIVLPNVELHLPV